MSSMRERSQVGASYKHQRCTGRPLLSDTHQYMWPTGSAVLFDLSECIYALNKRPVANKTTLSLFSLDLFTAHVYLEKKKFNKWKNSWL